MEDMKAWVERAVSTPQGVVRIYQIFLGDLNSFYVVSLESEGHGSAWGLGGSPQEALQDAARKWNSYWEGEKENSFLLKEVRFEPHSASLERLTGRERLAPDRDLYGD